MQTSDWPGEQRAQETFKEHAARIYRVAARKYDAGVLADDGAVVIVPADHPQLRVSGLQIEPEVSIICKEPRPYHPSNCHGSSHSQHRRNRLRG